MWQIGGDRDREINPTAKIEEIQEGAKEMKMRMEIKEDNVIKAAKMNDKEEDHEHRQEEISQKLTPGKEEEVRVEGSRDSREDNRDREESSRVHREQGSKIHKEGSKINKEELSRINQQEGNKTNQKEIDSGDREENRREHKEGQREEEMQEVDNKI